MLRNYLKATINYKMIKFDIIYFQSDEKENATSKKRKKSKVKHLRTY